MMKVAIVHYWLVAMRGGEKVLEALCRLFPQAEIFTHVYNPDAISDQIKQHAIRTTFINKLPFAKQLYPKYLPLMPLALEQLDLRGFDLVISSESGPAKGVLTSATTRHICYCHSPMRYLWDMYQDYLEELSPISRVGMRLLAPRLRQWDAISSMRVDHYVANSQTIAARIGKHYRRKAEVIHPPVDVAAFRPQDGIFSRPEPDAPYLCLGQLVGYKRVDLAVKACTATNRRLVVVGEGPFRKELQASAGPTVQFVGWLNPDAVKKQIIGCRALLFPGEEDFGIVPVETQAAGRPVIAYRKGGALETVKDGVTGLFFDEQTVPSLTDALDRFEQHEKDFDPQILNAHAQSFAPEFFDTAFMDTVTKVMRQTDNTDKQLSARNNLPPCGHF